MGENSSRNGTERRLNVMRRQYEYNARAYDEWSHDREKRRRRDDQRRSLIAARRKQEGLQAVPPPKLRDKVRSPRERLADRERCKADKQAKIEQELTQKAAQSDREQTERQAAQRQLQADKASRWKAYKTEAQAEWVRLKEEKQVEGRRLHAESLAGNSKKTESKISQHDKDNALKILVSSLNAAFMQGRRLYSIKVKSIDDFFDAVDSDSSGSVDREELSAALRRLGLGLNPGHIHTLMEVFDEDGGGEIERDEFTKILEWAGWGKKQKLPWQMQVRQSAYAQTKLAAGCAFESAQALATWVVAGLQGDENGAFCISQLRETHKDNKYQVFIDWLNAQLSDDSSKDSSATTGPFTTDDLTIAAECFLVLPDGEKFKEDHPEALTYRQQIEKPKTLDTNVDYSKSVSKISQHDKDNALKMLVFSLNAAFMQGRRLYSIKVKSIDDFFDAVDSDSGGSVDREELSAALRRLGLGLNPGHIHTLMEVFDEDGGGEIERDEFTKILEWAGGGKKQKLPWQMQVRQSAYAQTKLAANACSAEVQALARFIMQAADVNKSGELSCTELTTNLHGTKFRPFGEWAKDQKQK